MRYGILILYTSLQGQSGSETVDEKETVSWEGILIYQTERVERYFYYFPGNMIKTREDYQSYLSTQNTKRVEKHHILPVSVY